MSEMKEPKDIKVLVACEFSGIVRDAFLRRGFNAISCDLLPTEAPGPHYQGDVMDIIKGNWAYGYKKWDLLIAHPPCIYLSNAGVQYLLNGDYTLRYHKMILARDFFMKLYNADIKKKCIENPLPHGYADLPKYSQIIHPYMFGNNERKRTCLWLQNLPPLLPTSPMNDMPPAKSFCIRKSGSRKGKKYNYYYHQGKSAHERSRTFIGIAEAMASQWGDYLLKGDK